VRTLITCDEKVQGIGLACTFSRSQRPPCNFGLISSLEEESVATRSDFTLTTLRLNSKKYAASSKACPQSVQTVTAISTELLQVLNSSESKFLEEEVDSSLTAVLILVGTSIAWLVVSEQKQ